MPAKIVLWLSTSYFTGGFDLDIKGVILKAPPICQWSVGKSYMYIVNYFDRKHKLVDWKLLKIEKEGGLKNEKKVQ